MKDINLNRVLAFLSDSYISAESFFKDIMIDNDDEQVKLKASYQLKELAANRIADIFTSRKETHDKIVYGLLHKRGDLSYLSPMKIYWRNEKIHVRVNVSAAVMAHCMRGYLRTFEFGKSKKKKDLNLDRSLMNVNLKDLYDILQNYITEIKSIHFNNL